VVWGGTKQQIFQEMVLGTLVYSVVLGFFEDHTEILKTWSYSITFLVAIVLQILTYLTFQLKRVVVRHFKNKEGRRYKVALVFGVWLILFLSKFVFLAVIDVVFGEAVEISGFVGLMAIIISMTAIKMIIDQVYRRLA
jgi:tellurite resistance protein TehA-like permease